MLLYILSLAFSILTMWYQGGPFLSLAWIAFVPLAGICSYFAERHRDATPKNLLVRGLSVLSFSQLIASILVLALPAHPTTIGFDPITYKAYAIFFSFCSL